MSRENREGYHKASNSKWSDKEDLYDISESFEDVMKNIVILDSMKNVDNNGNT